MCKGKDFKVDTGLMVLYPKVIRVRMMNVPARDTRVPFRISLQIIGTPVWGFFRTVHEVT